MRRPCIQWIPDGDRLIADRCICFKVSWKQLNQQGLVFGTPIVIDGQPYMCRCLKVGTKEGDPNEWDDLLDRFGKQDRIWNWKYQEFWGQEISENLPTASIVRGGKSPRHRCLEMSASALSGTGFRPVLERIRPLPFDLSSITGKKVRVFGPSGKDITGILVSADEYDLVMEDAVFQPGIYKWILKDGNKIIANRKNVSYVIEV